MQGTDFHLAFKNTQAHRDLTGLCEFCIEVVLGFLQNLHVAKWFSLRVWRMMNSSPRRHVTVWQGIWLSLLSGQEYIVCPGC